MMEIPQAKPSNYDNFIYSQKKLYNNRLKVTHHYNDCASSIKSSRGEIIAYLPVDGLKYPKEIIDEYINLLVEMGFWIKEIGYKDFKELPPKLREDLHEWYYHETFTDDSKFLVYEINRKGEHDREKLGAYTAVRMLYMSRYQNLVEIILNLSRRGLDPFEAMTLAHINSNLTEFEDEGEIGVYYRFLVNTMRYDDREVRFLVPKDELDFSESVNACISHSFHTEDEKYVEYTLRLEKYIGNGDYDRAIELWNKRPTFNDNSEYSNLKKLMTW